LEFSFKQFIEELDAIRKVTEPFLDQNTTYVFDQYKKNFISIRDCVQDIPRNWSIPQTTPLKTNPSNGQYEPGDRGAHRVHAEISSTWDIMPLGDNSPKMYSTRKFQISGKASTIIRFVKSDDSSEIASWRLESGGDDTHPGCFFHMHINNESSTDIPVPRLPGILLTVGDALDFVLGELFQDDWKKHVSREEYNLKIWKNIQRERMLSLFAWKINTLKGTLGSPWIALKTAKPEASLLYAK